MSILENVRSRLAHSKPAAMNHGGRLTLLPLGEYRTPNLMKDVLIDPHYDPFRSLVPRPLKGCISSTQYAHSLTQSVTSIEGSQPPRFSQFDLSWPRKAIQLCDNDTEREGRQREIFRIVWCCSGVIVQLLTKHFYSSVVFLNLGATWVG